MNEHLLNQFKIVTGLSKYDILEALKNLTCSADHALDFFIAAGRFPTNNECSFINETGFDTWYALFKRNIVLS
jgi:hypothetical protein